MEIKDRIELCEVACKIGSEEFMKMVEKFSKFALDKHGEEISFDAYLSAIMSMVSTIITHTLDALSETYKQKINRIQLYELLINFLISKIDVKKGTMH